MRYCLDLLINMDIEILLKETVANAATALYGQAIGPEAVLLNRTPDEFDGHLTVVVFPFVKFARRKPEEVADDLGKAVTAASPHFVSYNVVKGFCNFVVAEGTWKQFLYSILQKGDNFGQWPSNGQSVVLEYSSPNTNKPLHLGHIRNNLLGYSACMVLEKAGYKVVKTQVINDRGIHICKSMLAWQRFGNGETPESSGMKGDHLVGKYYVAFENAFRKEYKTWQESSEAQALFGTWSENEKTIAKASKEIEVKKKKEFEKNGEPVGDLSVSKEDLQAYYFGEVYKNTYFNTHSELGRAAGQMLEAWEAGDPDVRQLWQMMNAWVYAGLDQTYRNLGVSFDKNYYESETYLLGKGIIEKGLASGAFYRKDDSSVWVDLSSIKLDEKLLLRSNGTTVYITQDIGMAPVRYEHYKMDKMVYVVGDEQDYHFKVLFEILKRMGEPYAAGLYHLSYGMVELPHGKMKSREGTVVDADDLMDLVISEVRAESEERETLADLSDAEKAEIYRKVAMAAMKFFILKVNPQSKMIFDPKKSIDLQGHTGPYIQNAYVRTQAVQRRAESITLGDPHGYQGLEPAEMELLRLLLEYPQVVRKAADTYNPAEVANFAYSLAQAYHKFWNDVTILRAPADAAAFRLDLSKAVAVALKSAMGLLGVEMPDRM